MTYTIPDGYTKRELFTRPAVAQLRKAKQMLSVKVTEGNIAEIVEHIATISPNDTYCLRGNLLEDESARHFKKHAPVVMVTSDLSPTKTLPRAICEYKSNDASGYGWHSGPTLQKVPLVKLLAGAKLFAYEAKKMPLGHIDAVTPYDDTPQVRTQGALCAVQVASRSEHHPRYTIIFSGIPTDEHASWRNVRARSTCCLDTLWRDARYDTLHAARTETACAHVICGYDKIAHAYFAAGNKIPAQRSPFPTPSQSLVDFAKRLDHVVVSTTQGARTKRNLLNEAQAEMLLMQYVRNHPDTSFGGKLLTLDWSMPN